MSATETAVALPPVVRGRDALVGALERVSLYAKDPNPTIDLRDAAHAAVIAFERAAIELAARKGTL